MFSFSIRALFRNLYRCTKCGYTVTVNRMLQPGEQKCPICGGHMAYMGSAK